jgi:hypothetical protein
VYYGELFITMKACLLTRVLTQYLKMTKNMSNPFAWIYKFFHKFKNSQFSRFNCHLSVMAKFEWCVMGHLKFSSNAKIGS